GEDGQCHRLPQTLVPSLGERHWGANEEPLDRVDPHGIDDFNPIFGPWDRRVANLDTILMRRTHVLILNRSGKPGAVQISRGMSRESVGSRDPIRLALGG